MTFADMDRGSSCEKSKSRKCRDRNDERPGHIIICFYLNFIEASLVPRLPSQPARTRQMRKTIEFEKLKLIDMTSENRRAVSNISSTKCNFRVVSPFHASLPWLHNFWLRKRV